MAVNTPGSFCACRHTIDISTTTTINISSSSSRPIGLVGFQKGSSTSPLQVVGTESFVPYTASFTQYSKRKTGGISCSSVRSSTVNRRRYCRIHRWLFITIVIAMAVVAVTQRSVQSSTQGHSNATAVSAGLFVNRVYGVLESAYLLMI